MSNLENKKAELVKLVTAAKEQDQLLREKYLIGDKFRFIKDKLAELLARIEENIKLNIDLSAPVIAQLLEDETLVYVYLFNAQGLMAHTWQKMLLPAVFYEYSVNRPIYADKNAVDAYVRTKANKAQHGYITIAVKKTDVIADLKPPVDALGNPIIRVKEGALKFTKMFAFTYNGEDFSLNANNELVRKLS